MEKAMTLFYLQDSRSHVGDGMMFWAKEARGYVTNLDQAELFTFEEACRHRDTDIPWPKEYIDVRAHYGVDCQLMDDDRRIAGLQAGARVYVHVPGDWNGNDVYWVSEQRGKVTENLQQARCMDLEIAQFTYANHAGQGTRVFWPAAYIEEIRRRLVHRQNVDHRQALRVAGVKMPRPPKVIRRREPMLNCCGCGRFISWDGRFLNNCRNCGANNCP